MPWSDVGLDAFAADSGSAIDDEVPAATPQGSSSKTHNEDGLAPTFRMGQDYTWIGKLGKPASCRHRFTAMLENRSSGITVACQALGAAANDVLGRPKMSPEPRFDPYTGEPVEAAYYRPAALRHSGPGIASLVMGIALSIAAFCTFIIAGVLEANTPGGMDEESPVAMVIGLLMMGFMVGMVAGMVLGIVGVVQGNRRNGLAIAGLLINGLFLLGTVALIVAGLTLS